MRPTKTLFQILLVTIVGCAVWLPASASAAKEVVASFGSEGTAGGAFSSFSSVRDGDTDVNSSGAGAADPGDLYVGDTDNNRIQRFGLNDHGTPSEPYDDTYEFFSAWGADVDGGNGTGSDYEICTVAAACKAALASAGNGDTGGNGGLSRPQGVAVDDDTGEVFVVDGDNNRVNVYEGDGTFLRAFGFDVVAFGPDDAGAGFEICIAAAGDVCKEGISGSGPGQLGSDGFFGMAEGIAITPADGDPSTGTVFVADGVNARVNTYSLEGATLGSFGSTSEFVANRPRPSKVAVDSRGIVYADTFLNGESLVRYDSQNANGDGVGFLEPISPYTVVVSGGTSPSPYTLTFTGSLRRQDVGQITVSSDADQPLTGGGAAVSTITQGSSSENEVQQLTVSATDGYFHLTFEGQTTEKILAQASPETIAEALSKLASIPAGPLPTEPINGNTGLEVDPDTDGPGGDSDILYVLRTVRGGKVFNTPPKSSVIQFGPLNPPGLTVAPATNDEVHGKSIGFSYAASLGVDPARDRLFVASSYPTAIGFSGTHVYILGEAGGAPSVSLDSISEITSTSAKINGTLNPNGPPPVSYRLEYSLDGATWVNVPSSETAVGTQDTPQAISVVLDPPGSGLLPNTTYHVRIAATKVFNPPIISAPLTFTTAPAGPQVETVGSPVRTATTAQLNGRVGPRGLATTYHFEYGSEGPCDANTCTSTSSRSAGSENVIQLVTEEVTGLQPGTTYHYRLVTENGGQTGPSFGEDMTVTTRSSDAPLSHGRFPGPPGSDRAWEQVSAPDTSGNPILYSQGFSDDGNRAIYRPAGGVPGSSTGSFLGFAFAQRPPGDHPRDGWQFNAVQPPRQELSGERWIATSASDDLSSLFAVNMDFAEGGNVKPLLFYRMEPSGSYTKLFSTTTEPIVRTAISEDGSRVVIVREGSDPGKPSEGRQIYDISDGSPSLVNVLPGGATCGSSIAFRSPGLTLPADATRHDDHWVSADGSLVFFECADPTGLYVRDLEGETTAQIASQATFIKSTPGAAFFSTSASLDTNDFGGADLYRFDLTTQERRCVTCVIDNFQTDAAGTAVSEDGSRAYFKSAHALLPGAPANGLYRVDVETGQLSYVAAIGSARVGDDRAEAQAINSDGSVVVFRSNDPSLNPLGGGSDNGGTFQYYRYDDTDRSLVCISCPQDGSVPLSDVEGRLGDRGLAGESGPNMTPISADGSMVGFVTATPLVNADQNAPPSGDLRRGADVYEWRDGRPLLVTDGLTDWTDATVTDSPPRMVGLTPSGRDLFFIASAQLTPDTLERSFRLYDARIGGGMDFPPPLKPCPLEVCQGTPRGTPEERAPSTGVFTGPGNVKGQPAARRCPKGRHKVRRAGKTRCLKRRSRANHNRRNAR